MNGRRLAEMPDWPAVMDAQIAALYLSLSMSSLLSLTAAGRFPKPIHLTNRRRGWRRADLDAWAAAGGIDGASAPNTLGGLIGWD